MAQTRRYLNRRNRQRWNTQSGVALVTTLLLLLLLTALSTAMVLAFSSDMLMTGYFRNYRAAFYAADAGNTIVRQDIRQRLESLVPNTILLGADPIPDTATAGIVTAINNAYSGASAPILINSAGAYQEKFQVLPSDTLISLASCTVSYYKDATLAVKLTTSPTTPCPPSGTYPYAYQYHYVYRYQVTTMGQAYGSEQASVTDSGNIIVNAISQDTINNFSQYGTFIDHNDVCAAYLIGGKITGPQFTNGGWTFGTTSAGYTFTDDVASAGANIGYYFSSNNCPQTTATSFTSGGSTIAPNFQKGITLGAKPIALPTSSLSQEWAVIDKTGDSPDPTADPKPDPTAQLQAQLRDVNDKTTYSPGTSGVYLPSTDGTSITGGGIFVEGAADVTLAAVDPYSEQYTITQGSVTTTVTIYNPPSGSPTTTIATSTTITGTGWHSTTTTTTAGPKTFTGVPTQIDNSSGTSVTRAAAVLYVNGNITSMSGTLQDNTALTVAGSNDIIINGDVKYKTSVVDSNGDETAAAAAGTATQTLGIFTAGGSVLLQAPYSNATMEIDASIMTTKDNGGPCSYGQTCDGVLGLNNGTSTINLLKIVGGRIQSRAMTMTSPTINQRNVFFDKRYNGTFAPPFFPKMKVVVNPSKHTSSVQRTGWVLRTAY